MSSAPPAPTPLLAEAKPLTFVDHVVNIFRLVIKELRSIRADPTMLILVVYAFSISVNTVATGAVTEATNLSVGIVDEDGSDLSRRIAEGLDTPDLPAVGADHSVPNRPDDGPGQAFVRRRDPAQFRGRHPRPTQDRHPDQRRRHRGRPGRQRRNFSGPPSPTRSSHSSPARMLRRRRRSIWSCARHLTRT